MNKKDKVITIIFVFVFILLVVPVLIKLVLDFTRDVVPEEISRIDYYGYSLSNSDTKLYKDTYKELDKVLSEESIDYKSYASLLSKLFIIDVFTLDNKLASTDIGGLEFVHDDFDENFRENLGATLYNHVQSNIDGNRTQKLPVVKSVNVNSVFETKYEYNKNKYDAYIVKCNFDYEVDLGYQTVITLTIINDNNILYVVKGE